MAQISIQQTLDLALLHHQAGRLGEAERLYRQILAQHPAHADAMQLLGLIAHQTGHSDAAVDLIRRAIALNPNFPEAYSNLGIALKDQGRFDEAIAAFRRAISLNPNLPGIHGNLGNALKHKGELDEAISAYRRAIALNPDYAEAHSHLGNALREKGQLDEAVVACQQAIALKPDYAEAYSNLGNMLKDKGQLDESIIAHRRAVALKPGYAEAHNNLANVLRDKGQLDEAVAACRQAVALRPAYAEAHSNLGSALTAQGRLDEAIAADRQAIALNPDLPIAHSNLILTLHYHPAYDAGAIAEEQRRWNRQHAQPFASSIRSHPNDRGPDRRLRIGYVSADFRTHASAYFLMPLLTRHDRRQVELFCYAQVVRPDEMTAQLRRHADAWRGIVGMSDEQVAEQIRADQIDILVDLKLHTGENRLPIFARKPAPVQAAWLGYPGSTGLTAIDYRLSDPYLDPPGMDECIYSERTIRLPDTFWCYDPLTVVPAVNDLPASAAADGHVTFGCLNNFCKVNDYLLSLWAKVLREVENSRLLLLAPMGSHRGRALERLGQEGIDPGRVEFIASQPRQKYLETYHRIDVGLDTFPYNGHTTSLDSFWMGVPVVTLLGSRAVGRAGWCQLSNLGLGELAGRAPEEFVRIAAELAKDLPRLQQLRSTLRRRMEQSPLMDAPRFARNVEAAYRRMWRVWCENPS